MAGGDDPITQVSDLRELDVDLTESLIGASDQLADAVVAPIHGRFPSEQHLESRIPLHLGVEFLQ